MKREIPQLQVLCLREVGSFSCSVEDTFAKGQNGKLSNASRLLRSFHERPLEGDLKEVSNACSTSSVSGISMRRTPCIGKGSGRRDQANEVDLNHPFIGCRRKRRNTSADNDAILVMEYGNAALDCLQSVVDSLVELGRMDDSRLGLHYFEEWKASVILGSETSESSGIAAPRKKNRRRGSHVSITGAKSQDSPEAKSLGSLSLHNCSFADETIGAMVESRMGECLGVLDLTGVHSLTDEMLTNLLPTCPNIVRLSIKNCRRLTRKSLELIGTNQLKLQCLDVGGSYNITPQDLLDTIPHVVQLNELHASGLSWTTSLVSSLTELRDHWVGLSIGFSPYLTAAGVKDALLATAPTLQRLSLPFCEAIVDNSLMSALGRNLPNVLYLDLRGNSNLSSLTGWYDGRVSANMKSQPLTVLARYTSITKQSLEETKRIHPVEAGHLICVLDGGGIGIGICR